MGLQKMTLLDFPGKTACTLFLGGCNFRCPYCHNAPLVTQTETSEELSETEFFTFLSRRRKHLDGVCITGGEPLLQKNLISFIQKIRQIGFLIKLDTNGSCPEHLEQLLSFGLLDYVAMDIKNDRDSYARTIGLPSFPTEVIERSMSILKRSNVPYEFRTTLVKEYHSETNIEQMGNWFEGDETLFLQNFEDSGNLISKKDLTPLSPDEMKRAAEILSPYVKNVQLRGM